jgi:uncharacterized protein (DUF952 family)
MLSFTLSALVSFAALPAEQPGEEVTPQYLYKVLSVENWKESQSAQSLKLSKDDEAFIHFSRDDQLERITAKYWAKSPEYIVLKIDTSKLTGKMVYEVNPGGVSKYYHLYDGSIPLESVSESTNVKN